MKMLTVVVLSVFAAVAAVADTIVLQPGLEGKDAFINEAGPDEQHGDNPYFAVGYSSSSECVSLIEWDISSVPEYAEVTDARMYLHCWNLWGEPPGQIKLSRVIELWNEMAVTWNNQPEYSDDMCAFGDWPDTGAWAEFDITEFVVAWYKGYFDNFGLRCASSDGGYEYIASLESSDNEDGALRPKLTITYEVDDPDEAVEPSTLGRVKAIYR